jgi:serine/threonine protein kinase/ankyrin repeat protein
MATSFAYRSIFAGESSTHNEKTNTSGADSRQVSSQNATDVSAVSAKSAGLASVICHVASLEASLLRGGKSKIFETLGIESSKRTKLGTGASFIVERAELKRNTDSTISSTGDNGGNKHKFVVIKRVREDPRNPDHWRDVLFEMRALLHEPIRYHPNIVRLIDVGWDDWSETGSYFPTLIQEYAEFGTLDKLQKGRPPLSFAVKQKLCYDVGRGLSILHACGIAHGDLKHENVLIFANKYSNPPNQPFTAKLADFGGTVMDMNREVSHEVPMNTFPYEAPEVSRGLTADGVKRTDTFSYGTLVWRCMVDCQDILSLIGYKLAGSKPTEQERGGLNLKKQSDEFLEWAIASIACHFNARSLPVQSFSLVASVLMSTLRGDPSQRELSRAQARMRGMSGTDAFHYVGMVERANEKRSEGLTFRLPGKHGLDLDGLGYSLGRLGDDYDAQNNLPGFRPDLPSPGGSGFLFDPLSLRHLLDWKQQEKMVSELQEAAEGTETDHNTTNLQPFSAAYFLYLCYLCSFGVQFDANRACHWLLRASNPTKEHAGVDYLAKACLTRVHAALHISDSRTLSEKMDGVFWGIVRGHRHCFEDSRNLIDTVTDADQRAAWREKMQLAHWNYRTRMGGTGMPYFVPRNLRRQYNLEDLDLLDAVLMEELGDEYQSCLRQNLDGDKSTQGDCQAHSTNGYRFDKIYVNKKGHGLLHLAASLGNLDMLKHIYSKYQCDINLANPSHEDTPLICACRSGNYECAMFCLDNGADPNGSVSSQESPLHCISNFVDTEMELIVKRLVNEGGDLEKHSMGSRKEITGILADWENNLGITVTPLGRAVLTQDLTAVRLLLDYGASPHKKQTVRKQANVSPLELAAVLTLPDILELLLSYTESGSEASEPQQLFDEYEMLREARSGAITPYDPLSLQSRLVRCGTHYVECLTRTMSILHARTLSPHRSTTPEEITRLTQLSEEIKFGNTDIVVALLDLGHPVTGSSGYWLVKSAVAANNYEIFRVLIYRGAPVTLEGSDDSMRPSLLQVSAGRARHTPPGTDIARCLIEKGVPPESERTDQYSALVLAIKNQYFDLANMLIDNGAGSSLNILYRLPTNANDDAISLLLNLLKDQTFSTLESVAFLAKIHDDEACPIRISPLATRDGVSVIHVLATFLDSERWNNHSQISARILQLVFKMFPNPESLGSYALFSLLGTPLSAAVFSGNTTMIQPLMDSDYSSDIGRAVNLPPQIRSALGEEAMNVYDLSTVLARRALLTLESSYLVTMDSIEKLRQRVDTASQLVARAPTQLDNSQIGHSSEAIWDNANIQVRLAALETKAKLTSALACPSGNEAGNFPIDLSILTEEKPVSWKEGEEMSMEQAMRGMLKSFRNDENFGDASSVLMDRTFNKRALGMRARD